MEIITDGQYVHSQPRSLLGIGFNHAVLNLANVQEEEVRRLVLDARELYEQHEFQFTGDDGDKGFIEEYTCLIQGAPTSAVVTVTRNAPGKAQHIVVNHRPRSSVLLFARVMGENYAGTPLAKYFIISESSRRL